MAQHRRGHLVAEREHGIVRDRVVAAQALAAARQQPAVGQQPEMFRGVGLSASKLCGQRADRALAVAQEIHQHQPAGIAQQAEPVGYGSGILGRKRMWKRHLRHRSACATI